MKTQLTIITAALLLSACGAQAPSLGQKTLNSAQERAEDRADKAGEDMEAAARKAAPVLTIEQAANSPQRAPENVLRNVYRHPVETLNFFGLKPGMTVVEVWPGGGWYSEIIAPALGAEGTFMAASYAPDNPESYRYKGRVKYEARLKNEPATFYNAYNGTLQPGVKVDIGAPGSADMVLTFRNNHSWIKEGISEQMYAEFFKVLKSGGTLGVVQHRAKEGADVEASAKKGYVPQAHVIKLAQDAGFELVEASEVNANPKDTADYAEGVWTLPPSLRLGDKDKAKYLAIGESDRMTLKFKKP